MSKLVEHAKRELELAGLFDKDSDYGGMIADAVLELIQVFSDQGHSGCSANMTTSLFNKLAQYKPLIPLTYDDDEWNESRDGDPEHYQNNRNSAVFKDAKDGTPYYVDAYTKRTPDGNCWHGSLQLKDGSVMGRCYIKDPSNMPTITIDVDEAEIAPNDWEMWVKDETQLEELAKYYDFEFTEAHEGN